MIKIEFENAVVSGLHLDTSKGEVLDFNGTAYICEDNVTLKPFLSSLIAQVVSGEPVKFSVQRVEKCW